MYKQLLTLKRNEALQHWHELKEVDPSIQGYVRYPATLMIKIAGERNVECKRNINFNIFPQVNLISQGALRTSSLRS